MISVGLIGYGYWGPKLARNFVDSRGCRLAAICDLNPERLAAAASRYPSIPALDDADAILLDPKIDAVVIATPVSSHFELARRALRAGKHVLVEKPLTSTAADAERLIEEAARMDRVLMVDHTFAYTGAVGKIRELVRGGDLGEINYYDSTRVNLGLFQHDVSVVWDLAVHDLSIMDHILGDAPTAVSATGIRHVPGAPENVAYLTLFFDRSMIAHINVNWLAPVKVRRTLIGGSRKMVVYDDLEPSEKVKVYDKGITVANETENLYKTLVGYRTGDMWAPQFDMTEALTTEIAHFLRCIEGRERPLTDGQAGLRVVRILEAASQSLVERGRPVELDLEVVS
ncbi:MAG: Gfo/Idh/MocA family oxidoreductase [Elusimicrobia bacterium]|nr:Gfo/Idh/MocA family oxidoreductase [Elusimicrobiota bacterium]